MGRLVGRINELPEVSEGDLRACPVGDPKANVPAAKQHELEPQSVKIPRKHVLNVPRRPSGDLFEVRELQ